MGTFDGVHRGHVRILEALRNVAEANKQDAVLLTFDPHPREVLGNNDEKICLLTTMEERLDMLETHGLNHCIVLPFTRDLSLLEPEEFFSNIIVDRLKTSHLIVGFDHAFGKGRQGKIDVLQHLGQQFGVDITIIPELDSDGEKISSTAIRHALLNGDVEKASLYLDRPYSFSGVVQRGDDRGASFGFPTANIHIDSLHKLLPKNGVYCVEIVLRGKQHYGMMNIGTRPTVSEGKEIFMEVHIFDFNEDIYGVTLLIRILHRIRDEMKFASVQALIAQLHDDKEVTTNYFAHKEIK